jgi:hypothetical protein
VHNRLTTNRGKCYEKEKGSPEELPYPKTKTPMS